MTSSLIYFVWQMFSQLRNHSSCSELEGELLEYLLLPQKQLDFCSVFNELNQQRFCDIKSSHDDRCSSWSRVTLLVQTLSTECWLPTSSTI